MDAIRHTPAGGLGRRAFLAASGAAVGVTGMLPQSCAPAPSAPTDPEARTTVTTPFLHLEARWAAPVPITRIEARKLPEGVTVRVTDADGAHGHAIGNERHALLTPILELCARAFLGQDARRLEFLVDEAYVKDSSYKLAGMPLFSCIGLVELAVWDLLAQRAGQPVHALLGPLVRTRLPAYVSRFERKNTAEEEVEAVHAQMAATGVTACKVKIGGRMSGNRDSLPGRTEALVRLLRERLGPDAVIYVDSNGSYDAPEAIRIGRILEECGVAFYEEPCPFQEYGETLAVAKALRIPVAGGEQDSSLPAFSWMIRQGALDIVQPDLIYVGGLIRALRVARMAERAGLPVTPHSPGNPLKTVYMRHFAAVVPNLGAHVEQSPHPGFTGGAVAVPQGVGWGWDWDAAGFGKGEPLFALVR